MAIISKAVSPPGGWLFQGLGITIRGVSYDDLVFLVKAHCTNNKIKVDKPYDQIVSDYFIAKFPKLEIKSASVMAPHDSSGLYKHEEKKVNQIQPSGVMGWTPMVPGQQPTTPTIETQPSTGTTINITPVIPQNVPTENPLTKVEAQQPVVPPEPPVVKRRGRPKKVIA